jgi:hypothetical protein
MEEDKDKKEEIFYNKESMPLWKGVLFGVTIIFLIWQFSEIIIWVFEWVFEEKWRFWS